MGVQDILRYAQIWPDLLRTLPSQFPAGLARSSINQQSGALDRLPPSQPPLHCTLWTNLTAASYLVQCARDISTPSLFQMVFPPKSSKKMVNVIDIISSSHWIESMRRLTRRKIEEFALVSWLRLNSPTAETSRVAGSKKHLKPSDTDTKTSIYQI